MKGGEADGGLSSTVIDVHVWYVHLGFADLPQKEIDPP
jgi:hypothetical protein